MWSLDITDLKQWAYCPRIVYYRYCMPLLCPETYKMQASHGAHQREQEREQRRSLSAYGLVEGRRHYEVYLASPDWGIVGRVDLVIETEDEVIPVDYKQSTRRPGAHFRLQLAAYGQLCEEHWGKPARRGFLYLMPLRRAEEVVLSEGVRRRMSQAVGAIRRMIETESVPPPAQGRQRCVNCEFRRFCNDVV